MNYVIPSSAFFSSPFSLLSILYEYRDLPFESILQEAVVLYVRGHCTLIEYSLLDTTLGGSPPKAAEQIICTRVLVNYLELRPPLFQMT